MPELARSDSVLGKAFDELHGLWSSLEISFARRQAFDDAIRAMKDNRASMLGRTRQEIDRLRKLVPLMGTEMALVSQRETLCSQLRHARAEAAAASSGSDGGAKRRLAEQRAAHLQSEVDSATARLVPVLRAWESKHRLDFVYRGQAYLATIDK